MEKMMNLFKKPEVAINTTKEKKFIMSVLGDQLTTLFKNYKAVLAGGCITSLFSRTDINDFDIFVDSSETYEALCKQMMELSKTPPTLIDDAFRNTTPKPIPITNMIHESPNARTYNVKTENSIELRRIECTYGIGFDLGINENEIKVQIINPILNSTKDLLSHFDFTICMSSFDFGSGEFEFDPRFLVDLSRKELRYNTECRSPFGSFFRMKKYLDRGFHIDPSECLKIILSCRKVSINTFSDFADAIFTVPDTRLRSHVEALIYDGGKELAESEFNTETALEWIEDYIINGPHVPKEYKERAEWCYKRKVV